MLVVADVHGAFDALRQLVNRGRPVVVLGDLINFVDYRTGEGIAADVFGYDFARRAAEHRRRGDFAASRALWHQQASGDEERIRRVVRQAISDQYRSMRTALEGGTGFVTHGNVDVPEALVASLPHGFDYVHGQVVEIDGVRWGIIGGGTMTGLNASGEIGEGPMAELLDEMGPVDVLGTHVPPAIDPLRRDVITGRLEGGSEAITDYLRTHRPAYHYFGDVHQPQASRWRFGQTTCINVGYFRATRRAVAHA